MLGIEDISEAGRRKRPEEESQEESQEGARMVRGWIKCHLLSPEENIAKATCYRYEDMHLSMMSGPVGPLSQPYKFSGVWSAG
jgi:hypothetical protein